MRNKPTYVLKTRPPFNLVGVFSYASLISIVFLMVTLSWGLARMVERQLLERDKIVAASTVQARTSEYLKNYPFSFTFENPTIHGEIFQILMSIPGTYQIEMIDLKGEIVWSNNEGEIGQAEERPGLRYALAGTEVVQFVGRSSSWIDFSLSRSYRSVLFIPVKRRGEVIGVFELYRNNFELFNQLNSIKKKVYLFCLIFGLLLYGILMAIVIPAAKTINFQYKNLVANAESLKALNIELKQAQKQLIEKERLSAIGEVCGAVAHGLKNPIASVRAGVQLLNTRELPEEEQREIAGDIIHDVDRLAGRLDNLLNFIRPYEVKTKRLHLSHILKKTTRELHWQAVDSGLVVEVLVQPGLKDIHLDQSLVEEAILIILGNAINASSVGGTITCTVEQSKKFQRVTIKDTGYGIPENIMPRIFEPFFTTRSQGVGMGLFLCKKYMDLHGGRVIIKSVAGSGTISRLIFKQTNSGI